MREGGGSGGLLATSSGFGILGCKEALVVVLSDNSGRKSLSSFIGGIKGSRFVACSHGCWWCIVGVILDLNKAV